MNGYSDRINHALAFAAKHHDQQVRKGTRAPYRTAPANVAVILTRYGCDEGTVVGGILHDVVEDYMRDGSSRDVLNQRVGEKFGTEVLQAVMAVVMRRTGDDGVELSADDRREDCLARLPDAPESARWTCAAVSLHGAATLAADLRRTVDRESIWSRGVTGKQQTVGWFRAVADRLASCGFTAPIMVELSTTIQELEVLAGSG